MPDAGAARAAGAGAVPEHGLSKDADKTAKTVTCDGSPICITGSEFATSTGDEAGSAGGVASGCTKGKARFIAGSFDVMVEGKPVVRFGDQMLGNLGGAANTPPMPEQQAPAPAARQVAPGELKQDFVEVTVVDGAGEPLPDLEWELHAPGGKRLTGTTDASGRIEVKETIRGIATLRFPKLPLLAVELCE